MSGRKDSLFLLAREIEAKLQQMREVHDLRAEVEGLRQRLAATLEGLSPGLRATFAGEVARVQAWLAQSELPGLGALGMFSSGDSLRATVDRLERLAVQARALQEELSVGLVRKADEIGKRLAKRLAAVERLYIARRELLGLWGAQSQIQAWERTLADARQMLEHEQYSTLESALSSLATEIGARIQFAEEQEAKHQKRLYLLKALRQVCAELGFREVSEPRFEREDERGSRIVFTVDTLDRGQIAFTLSLDAISSFSEIADEKCFEEFGQLSRYLEEEFGIRTEFKTEDGRPIPKLLRKGEMDLPGDASKRAEA